MSRRRKPSDAVWQKQEGKKIVGKRNDERQEDEDEVEDRLQSLLNTIKDQQDQDENESLTSLIEETDHIMRELMEQSQRDIDEAQQFVVPKRLEMEQLIGKSLQERIQSVEEQRTGPLTEITHALNNFKEIRDRLQALLQDIDNDLSSLKDTTDKDLIKDMEKARNQEAESLRKEVSFILEFMIQNLALKYCYLSYFPNFM